MIFIWQKYKIIYNLINNLIFKIKIMTKIKHLLGFVFGILILFWYWFCNTVGFSSYTLDFTDFTATMGEKFQEIHFWHLWSDFWGGLFITELQNVSETITINSTSYSVTCQQKLKWYYRNPMRWSNLVFPISQDDLTYRKGQSATNYQNLTLEWWFYTNCSWYQDSIIWQVSYKYNGTNMFSIVAWRYYDTSNWLIDQTKWFANTFQYYNWVTPIWLLFDSSFELGMVWAQIVTGATTDAMKLITASTDTNWFIKLVTWFNNWNWVNKYIEKIEDKLVYFINWWDRVYWKRWNINTIINKNVIGVLWTQSVWAWAVSNKWNLQTATKQLSTYKWDSYNQISYSLWTNFNSFASSRNTIKKNGEAMCKWKWIKLSSTTTITTSSSNFKKWETNCYDSSGNDSEVKIIIDSDITTDWAVTNIMTKWSQFALIITTSQVNNWYINAFIDGWILAIQDKDSGSNPWNLVAFDWNWEYSSSSTIAKWFLLKWNFFVNGLIWWWQSSNLGDTSSSAFKAYRHKLYIHGSLWSLNTIEQPSAQRTTLIESLLTNLMVKSVFENIIDLRNAFAWRCTENTSVWTDWTTCSASSLDQWSSNALIVINKSLVNKFYNK